jgi:hypothetical protein
MVVNDKIACHLHIFYAFITYLTCKFVFNIFRLCSPSVNFFKSQKNLQISGPAQFKLMLFKDQLFNSQNDFIRQIFLFPFINEENETQRI